MDNKQYLKKKYPMLDDDDIDVFIASAESIYRSRTGYENVKSKHLNWILRCCMELIDKDGFSGTTGYSENGISFSFDTSQVSYGLLNELPNNVRVYDKRGNRIKND